MNRASTAVAWFCVIVALLFVTFVLGLIAYKIWEAVL